MDGRILCFILQSTWKYSAFFVHTSRKSIVTKILGLLTKILHWSDKSQATLYYLLLEHLTVLFLTA
jgi:hypothetical protein